MQDDLEDTLDATDRLINAMHRLSAAFCALSDLVGDRHVLLVLCVQQLNLNGIPMEVEELRELMADAKAEPLAIVRAGQ